MDLTSLQTTAQNVAQNINALAQTYLNVQGAQSLADIDAATLVMSGAGRIGRVSVIDGGSADGAIYDANDAALTSNQVYVIPQTAGVYEVFMPVNSGIVVAPGTGQLVAISYSTNLNAA